MTSILKVDTLQKANGATPTAADLGINTTGNVLQVGNAVFTGHMSIGTYTYTEQDFIDTAHAIFDGSFGSLDWYQTRPLSEGNDAFEQILNGEIAAPKIVLNP